MLYFLSFWCETKRQRSVGSTVIASQVLTRTQFKFLWREFVNWFMFIRPYDSNPSAVPTTWWWSMVWKISWPYQFVWMPVCCVRTHLRHWRMVSSHRPQGTAGWTSNCSCSADGLSQSPAKQKQFERQCQSRELPQTAASCHECQQSVTPTCVLSELWGRAFVERLFAATIPLYLIYIIFN